MFCFSKNFMKNLSRQLPGERVLLARMVGGQKHQLFPELSRSAVAKLWARLGNDSARFLVGLEKGIESDLSKHEHDADVFQKVQFLHEIGTTFFEFIFCRLVRRRGAAHSRGDVTALEFQSVVPAHGIRLIRKTKPVQSPIQPVPAAIPGKYSTGAISPMGRRGESDNKKTRFWIAESR